LLITIQVIDLDVVFDGERLQYQPMHVGIRVFSAHSEAQCEIAMRQCGAKHLPLSGAARFTNIHHSSI